MQIVAEICQNRTAGKYRFFQKSSVAKIEKCKMNKSYIITWGMCTKNRRSIQRSGIFLQIFTARRRNLFRDNNFPKSYLLPIRGNSWQKNEIKRIRRSHYSGNNFQNSTKEKLLKENMGYLPRVLFFNAFQLGAESKNQVFSSEEASRSIP
jgi:hypothetical protein